MKKSQELTKSVYLIVSADNLGQSKFFDLYPTACDAVLGLRDKLTLHVQIMSGEQDDLPEPSWKTSEVSVFKVSKYDICEEFDEIFGEAEACGDYSCWFDIYLSPETEAKFISCKLDTGRFILENTKPIEKKGRK